MSDEELKRLLDRIEQGEVLKREEYLALVAEVRELQFRRWYEARRLDAWASKAMALEHLLKREESRVTGYTLIQMEYEDGKFRQVCDEVNERLREWFKQHRPDTYHAILEKHGRTQEGGNG